MAHIPHLYLPGPWEAPSIGLERRQHKHLTQVLRRNDGSSVSYTDGQGTTGRGTLEGSLVTRGEEGRVGPPRPTLCVAVAPVRARDRVRFLVEKLAELGVDELRWIRTRYGQGAPPDRDKARSWAVGALEQSKGAWLMDISGPVPVDALDGDLLVADPRGGSFVPSDSSRYTLVVGPEGGFADGEVPSGSIPVSLSSRILRTETAAIVGAATLLSDLGRQET